MKFAGSTFASGKLFAPVLTAESPISIGDIRKYLHEVCEV